MKRTLIKIAILPTRMSDGTWIWFSLFEKHQEYKPVWCVVEDYGWPDPSTWGWEDRWVTLSKNVYSITK